MMITRAIKLDNQLTTDVSEGDVPEEVMAFSDAVVGNGQARVSVSTPVDMKTFGNGSGASVSITLSCNQDDETIATVVRQLGAWTRFFAKEQASMADDEFRQLYAQRYPGKQL
jgi:hypothetical protein